MARVRFLLRDLSSTEFQSVYVSFRFGRDAKLMYALPIKAESIYWDADRGRVKNSKFCPYRNKVNAAITEIGSFLEDIVATSALDGTQVTKQMMTEALDEHLGKAVPKREFHGFFETYIEECDRRQNGRRGGQNVTYKTKREYARTYELLKEYEKESGQILSFKDIDQAFIASFVSFLQERNLATNTIAHKVITLKALMRAAVERELTDNMKWRYYKNATEETDAVSLDGRELEMIRTAIMPNDRLSRIRDLFLMECWTGLRYSDVMSLRRENVQNGMIVVRQHKTDNVVTIPVHQVFKEIWERYGGIPIILSNQKFNAHIKEVCRMAGITGKVLKSITKGGKRIITRHEKWQLVSSHTGRRSFATNLYRSGFPSMSIMQITGHKTESAFLKYIKVSREEHAKLLAKHWKETNQ